MPRLFTGLELPGDARAHLSLLRGTLTSAHWIAPEDMHLTLRFAGDVTDLQADDFAERLADIDLPTFEMEITGTGAFGGSKPHAVYAAIAPNEALVALQRAHERAARAAGLGPEPRGFTAHVTLARLRGARPLAVAQFLEETGGLRIKPFTVDRFVLFSARPGLGGGPYAAEVVFDLGNR